MFACCLDQVGVLEMRHMPRATSGVVILSESFSNYQFKDSYKKFFSKDANGVMSASAQPPVSKRSHVCLDMGFNAVVEVQTSKELRVCGAIGHVTSLNKKTAGVSADTVRPP